MKGQPACQHVSPKPAPQPGKKEKEQKYQALQMGETPEVASPFFGTAGVVLAVALLGIAFKRVLSSGAAHAGSDQASSLDKEDRMASAAGLE